MTILNYKFRIYPSAIIQEKLNIHLELCRELYNRLLEELHKAKLDNRKISQKDTQALITQLKKEKSELNVVYSRVLQMVNYQLWSNTKALSQLKKKGKKIGRLRFKGKGWFKTVNYNQSGFKLEDKKLILSKVGEIPIKLHRQITGKIKGLIIKRANSGKWFAIFQVEQRPEPLPKTGKTIGLDIGIKHFLTDSQGRQIENPKFYEKTLKKIKTVQHWLSNKKKGSNNKKKQKIKLGKLFEKLINQRDDFLHKLSRFYINNYDFIFIEGLNVLKMVKNHLFSQKILDTSWSKFFQMLSYKTERAGKIVIKVDPKGTSKIR
ncbi:MAG: RNA-guided endonuclease TnpB family protein [Patescibacteria group bacterium]|nr:RNA-guided endonuclease TnpB family protein [Patescibacteria group bacterium]